MSEEESRSGSQPGKPGSKTGKINYVKNNVIAIIAIIGLITTWVQIARVTKPHTELEDANTQLSILITHMDCLDDYIHSENVGERAAEGEDVMNRAERFRNGAIAAIQIHDFPRSLRLITAASQLIDGYLPHEADIKPGTVTITVGPFQGWVDIDIAENTTARSEDGVPVNTIIISSDGAPPDAYKDYASVLAFEISPTGTIFSSPITLNFSYLVSNIPKGVREEDLILGTWDTKTGGWTILASHVDLETHTISASTSHLTLLAVLAPRPQCFCLSLFCRLLHILSFGRMGHG
jgi:hypothetical protein